MIGWLLLPAAAVSGYRVGRWVARNAQRLNVEVAQMEQAWNAGLGSAA